jgi:EmrB/QacA subfamily drug resistance transporter
VTATSNPAAPATAVAAPPPGLAPFERSGRAYELRWYTLAVLCISLLVIVVDNSILNVAIPTLVKDLHATNSELQWMVDSYSLVFACLLLTAGALGDRYGRRGALQVGFAVFGFGSLLSAFAGSPNQLIGTRAVMGIGAAFIMPATLSIITNTFPPEERGRAIGFWAAIAGVAGALGPITGGFLLEHFYWGSIFLVNIPIVVFALVMSVMIIPTSKDPSKPKQDPIGATLSIIGLSSLVFGIIQGGNVAVGWSDPQTITAFIIAAVVLTLFAWWESRVDSPMLDTSVFTRPRFSAASGAITTTFFAMFGATFILTQYLQFVLGFSPLKAGAALLPWALVMMVVSPTSARLVERVGTKVVVGGGLATVAVALFLLSMLTATDGYIDIVWRMMLMAAGMGCVMAPATESIMGSLPRAKAGVGSAVNDTTRQTGGLLGVAVIGSVFASAYASSLEKSIPSALSPKVAEQAKEGLGSALEIASRAQLPQFASAAKDAFVDGMQRGLIVAVIAAVVGAIVAFAFLPARGTEPEQ